ncbi:ABC transporter permease [Calidifontibacter terrae]
MTANSDVRGVAIARPSPLHLLDYWLTIYRRTWRGSVFTSFITPWFYVVAMGVLLGGFVTADPATLEGASSYLAFVVPGMICAQSMQVGFGETTYPVMGMRKWVKTYDAQLATPLRVSDILQAHVLFILFRILTTAVVFTAVIAFFDVFQRWWSAPVLIAVQILVGLAAALPVYAYAVRAKSESGFSVVFRLLMIPLTLFSGSFFPIATLPPVLEAAARLSPLWQGVNLCRMASTGHWDWPMATYNLAYLVALAVVGYLLTLRGMRRELVP